MVSRLRRRAEREEAQDDAAEREEAPEDEAAGSDPGWDFAWTQTRANDPEDATESGGTGAGTGDGAEDRARRRRPRLPRPRLPHIASLRRQPRWVLLAVAAVLLAGAGAGVLIVAGGERERTSAERSQLEAAAPGSSRHSRPTLAVPSAVQRAAARLSLPRQIQQLMIVDAEGYYPRDPFFARLRARAWGGVLLGPANFLDESQFAALTGEVEVVARRARHVRPLIAVSQAGGGASAFPDLPPRPQPLVGETRRPAIAAREAQAAARALRARRVNMTLAPIADVGTAVGPFADLVFGDDPRLVASMTRAAVDGWRRGRVISAVGHFPGTGSASEDPSVATATVGQSLPDLRRRDLLPFAAVAPRVPVVIVSNAVYAAYDGVTPAVALPDVIGKLLRRDLGFKGVVMTDDLNSTAPVLGRNVGTAAIMSMKAGADLLYVAGGRPQQEQVYRAITAAVRRGEISRERLSLSVQRVLALKRGYGLLPAAKARPRTPKRAKPTPRPAPSRTPASPPSPDLGPK